MIITILILAYLTFCACFATSDLRAKYQRQKYLTPAEVIESIFSFWFIGLGLLCLIVGLIIFYMGMGVFYTYVYARKLFSFKLNKNFWISVKIVTLLCLVTSILFGPIAEDKIFFFELQITGWFLAVIGNTIVLNMKDKNGQE